MTTEEKISELFNDKLGENYDIKAYDNDFTSWDNILTNNMIHAVLYSINGETKSQDGVKMRIVAYTFSFAIPSEKEIFSKEYANIENVFTEMHQQTIDIENSKVYLQFNGIMPSVKMTSVGTEYARTDVSMTAIIFEGLSLAKSGMVKIDGIDLKGLFTVVYDVSKSLKGKVSSDGKQENYVLATNVMITCDFILSLDDEIHKSLVEAAETNKDFAVTYDNGVKAKTESGVIIGKYTEQAIIGDAIKCSIQFVKGE